MTPPRQTPDLTELQVVDLMTPEPFTATEDSNLDEVSDLMRTHGIRHIPIVDGAGALVGLVTHRDLLGKAFGGGQDLPRSIRQPYLRSIAVRDVMTRNVLAVTPEQLVTDVACRMVSHRYGCLPVVRDEQVVGIITASDFVRYIAGCA